MTTLVEHGRKNERTHKVTRLAQAVDKAVDKLVEEGEKIAQENPKIQNDMLKACHNVTTAGTVYRVPLCTHTHTHVHSTHHNTQTHVCLSVHACMCTYTTNSTHY